MKREYNKIINQKEFEEGKLILKSRPRVLFLELTRNCNLYCSMCRPYNWYRSDWYMNEQVLNKVRDELFPYIEMVDLRGFGESTMDNRLIALASELEEKGIKTMIFSNMNTQNEDYWRQLVKTNINIALSIETSDPIKYSKIRRGGNFTRMKNNLLSAINAAEHTNIPYFTVVLSDDNIKEIKGLINFADECGITKIQLNPISRPDPNDRNGVCLYGFDKISKDEIRKEFEDIIELAQKKKIRVELAANLFNENNVIKDKCIHPWSYVFIRYDGAVGFCDHLARVDASLKGNIMNTSFMEIWNGTLYQELRKAHRIHDYSMFELEGIECKWCEKNRYGNCEYIIDKKFEAIELSKYYDINF